MPGKRRREPFSISKPGRRWRDDTLEALSRRTPGAGAKGPQKNQVGRTRGPGRAGR